MTQQEYFLLKLIDSVPEVAGRKKLQKLIYVMKHIGLPIELRYNWHYYGPYSAELALQIDALVNANLLDEKNISLGYTYKTSKAAKELLSIIELNPENKKAVKLVSSWVEDFRTFSDFSVSALEKATSVLFWKDWGKNNADAIRTTESFKGKLTDAACKIIRTVNHLKAANSSN